MLTKIERGLNRTITENKQLMYRFTNFINTASKELAEELIAPVSTNECRGTRTWSH